MNTRINLRLIDLHPNQVNLVAGPHHSFKTQFLLNALLELPLNYPNSTGHQPRPAEQCIPVTLLIGEMDLTEVYDQLNTALDLKFRRPRDPHNDIHRYFQCYGYTLDVVGIASPDIPVETLTDLAQRGSGGFVFVDGISNPTLHEHISRICESHDITVVGTTQLIIPSGNREFLIDTFSGLCATSPETVTHIGVDRVTDPTAQHLIVARGNTVRTLPLAPLTTQFWVTCPLGTVEPLRTGVT